MWTFVRLCFSEVDIRPEFSSPILLVSVLGCFEFPLLLAVSRVQPPLLLSWPMSLPDISNVFQVSFRRENS